MTHADALTSRFIDALSHHSLVDGRARIVAAVSGGADSVALLHLLITARKPHPFGLFVVHVNHGLRGAEADADQHFVEELCRQHSLSCHSERVDVPADRTARGGSIEEAARRVRYEVFARAAKHFNATHIALAHHADDQAETVLFNVTRGTSIHGLRGMPASRLLNDDIDSPCIVRPLLTFRRTELRGFLVEQNLPWREDATNQLSNTSRNLLRNDVIPMLQTLHPAFVESILSLASDAASCETLVAAEATEALESAIRSDSTISLPTSIFTELHALVANEVLRQMMLIAGVPAGRITRELIDLLRRMVTDPTATSIDLPNGVCAWREDSLLHVGTTPAMRAPRWSMHDFPTNAEAIRDFLRTKSSTEELIDADAIRGSIVLRRTNVGERFHPLGSSGTKTVGDFLTDHKVPTHQRPAWVLADDLGIAWLIGRRIDHRVRLTDATKHILRLATDSAI